MRLNWNEAFGYGMIVAASCFWGASASLGKRIMQNGITTVMLMQTRSLITAATILILLLFFSQRHLRIRLQDLTGLVLLAIPGLALVNVSYYNAVRLLSVGIAVFIQFTAPVLIFLYGLSTKKEKASRGKFLALLFSLAGTYLMLELYANSSVQLPLFGLFCAFVSAVSYAFYVLLSHHLGKSHSSWTLILYGYGIASLFWCVLQNPSDTLELISANRLQEEVILFAFVSTLIPFTIFLQGLRRVTPTGAAIASTTETVSATFFAFLFLGEILSTPQIVGAGMILTALLILVYQSKTILEEV